MMVDCRKNLLFYFSLCLLVSCLCFVLTGCKSKQNIINTHSMPGHKFSNLLNNTTREQESVTNKNSPLTKTKSGVYIYKDGSTVNTTGYKFHIKDKTNIGPTDVRFDAEHFRTKY